MLPVTRFIYIASNYYPMGELTQTEYRNRFRKENPFQCNVGNMDCTKRFSTNEERISHEWKAHKHKQYEGISFPSKQFPDEEEF